MKTLDMQHIRYLNLFEKVCRVRPEYCFLYNSSIVFVLEKEGVSRAIGQEGRNTKKLYHILGKKVKVVGKPSGVSEVKEFVTAIITPTSFRNIEVIGGDGEGGEIIIQAGKVNKANLIGRGKTRLVELQKVVRIYFGKELRVV